MAPHILLLLIMIINQINIKNGYHLIFFIKLLSNFIPPKFAVGYLALSSEIIVNYKQTTYYGDFKQFTIKYNDNNFKFKWPNKKFILSKRDM